MGKYFHKMKKSKSSNGLTYLLILKIMQSSSLEERTFQAFKKTELFQFVGFHQFTCNGFLKTCVSERLFVQSTLMIFFFVTYF
uniref:Uncharacterized protein n=1 Tax=Anguilla anguilla TaxID=7936 RepID=A0A0E9XET3_ANGAN